MTKRTMNDHILDGLPQGRELTEGEPSVRASRRVGDEDLERTFLSRVDEDFARSKSELDSIIESREEDVKELEALLREASAIRDGEQGARSAFKERYGSAEHPVRALLPRLDPEPPAYAKEEWAKQVARVVSALENAKSDWTQARAWKDEYFDPERVRAIRDHATMLDQMLRGDDPAFRSKVAKPARWARCVKLALDDLLANVLGEPPFEFAARRLHHELLTIDSSAEVSEVEIRAVLVEFLEQTRTPTASAVSSLATKIAQTANCPWARTVKNSNWDVPPRPR